MDVTPPGAAGTASRPSRTTHSGFPLVLRRLAVGLAGAALAVLAGVACALSFDDLRALAVSGRAEPRLAYLYPAAFDVLLAVALVSVPLLRGARFPVRLQAGFILLLLLASAATADAATAVGAALDPDASALVVALLPWAMLALGLWLLLLLLKHVRTNRVDLGEDSYHGDSDAGDSDEGLVPFDGERDSRAATPSSPVGSYPVQDRAAHTPAQGGAQGEHGASPLQPVPEAVAPIGYVPPLPVSPVSETVAPPAYAPPLPVVPVAHDDADGPRAGAAQAPVTPDTDEDGVRVPPEALPAATSAAEPAPEPAATSTAGPGPRPDPEDERDERDERESLPLVPSTAAAGTPPLTETDEPHTQTTDSTNTANTANAAHAAGAGNTPDAVGSPGTGGTANTAGADTGTDTGTGTDERPRRDRPMRWGDLVRPHEGDVLVHPRPNPEEPRQPVHTEPADTEPAGTEPDGTEPDGHEDEAGVDTQPLRHIRDVPDPAHAADSAERDELDRRRTPYGTESDGQGAGEEDDLPMAPPSGRMRSTPRPPA